VLPLLTDILYSYSQALQYFTGTALYSSSLTDLPAAALAAIARDGNKLSPLVCSLILVAHIYSQLDTLGALVR
jgi:hypothetical protein